MIIIKHSFNKKCRKSILMRCRFMQIRSHGPKIKLLGKEGNLNRKSCTWFVNQHSQYTWRKICKDEFFKQTTYISIKFSHYHLMIWKVYRMYNWNSSWMICKYKIQCVSKCSFNQLLQLNSSSIRHQLWVHSFYASFFFYKQWKQE